MLMADPRWASVRRGGMVDVRWLQTVELPAARAFSRGYDRVAVDGLLDECADTIGDLTGELRTAYDEMAVLRRQAMTRAARHSRVGATGRARRQLRQPSRATRRRRTVPARSILPVR